MMSFDTQHGGLMDRVYRNQRHIYDLTRKFFLLGRDRLLADLAPPPEGRVLEIGCGTGRNLLAVARMFPGIECYGIDISSHMLETAKFSIRRVGMGDRVFVSLADATAIRAEDLFEIDRFDRIFISYTLSMIPRWNQALRQAVKLLASAGSLHVIDFGRQSNLPNWFRWILRSWLNIFHVSPCLELGNELVKMAGDEGLRATVHELYRGYAVYGILRDA